MRTREVNTCLAAAILSMAAFIAASGPATVTQPTSGASGAPGYGHAANLVTPTRPAPSFELNMGQAPQEVRFLARSAGYLADFASDHITLWVAPSEDPAGPATRVRMRLVGARGEAPIEGLDPLVTRSHFYRGSDRSGWVENVPHYGRIRYGQVYPGIDLDFYGEGDDLEYDFVVAPGAEPDVIRIAFDGVSRVQLDQNGDLRLETSAGALRQARPVIYQEMDGQRRTVDGGYVRRGDDTVGFRLGLYDPSLPLVIDPTLVFSSYHGLVWFDAALDVAADEAGNFYVAGRADHRTTADNDVYVTKFSPDGRILYWSWIGTAIWDEPGGVAVDSAGVAHLVGTTFSHPSFPLTADAKQPTPGGGGEAFVAKFDASGRLIYSSWLGGSGGDSAADVKVAPDGTTYVAGGTGSADFPGAGSAPSGGDAFVAVLAPDGTVVRSTFVGGTAAESAQGAQTLSLTDSGLVLVGTTSSADFPIRQEGTIPVPQATFGGGESDLFVAVLRDGAIVRSTFWGGSGADRLTDAASNAGATVITGTTDSPDFPSIRPVQDGFSRLPENFLMRLVHGPDGDSVAFSTYMYESGGAVATDASGAVFTSGPNTFAAKLGPGGSVDYLFHGADGTSMVVSPSQRICVVGRDKFLLVPTLHAHRPHSDLAAARGRGDGFVTILADGENPGATREQDDPAVAYSGTWRTHPMPFHSGGSAAMSREVGAQAVIRFQGTGIQLLGYRSPRSGILRLTLFNEDWGFETPFLTNLEVDTYASRAEARSLLVSLERLPPTPPGSSAYSLILTVKGSRNPRSSDDWIFIDGFNVLGGP